MESYNVPTVVAPSDYPGEQISGDPTVQGRDYHGPSVDYFKNTDSSGGTVISYATSGYRSDLGGATDIDFDDKQAYESIDRFQDRRVVANPDSSGICPPPSGMPQVRMPGQCDMPDYVTKKGWVSLRRCLCFSIILTLITLLIAVAGAAIAVYALLSFYGILSSGTMTATSNPTIAMLQIQLAESQALIEELRTNLTDQAISQAELSIQVASLIGPANSTGMTNAFEGCETRIVRTCLVAHNTPNPGSNPAFSSCATPEISLQSSDPERTVVDVYCGIDNSGGERNPISSNLDIFDGAASCSCFIFHSPTPTSSISCNLYMKTCPI